jgi:hypothetical protein
MSEAATEFKPNLEKLRRLQQQASSVVIGGKVIFDNAFLNKIHSSNIFFCEYN